MFIICLRNVHTISDLVFILCTEYETNYLQAHKMVRFKTVSTQTRYQMHSNSVQTKIMQQVLQIVFREKIKC